MKKEVLEQKASEGKSIRQIAKETELSYSTIRYWLKTYKLKTHASNPGHKWIKNLNQWSKENIEKALIGAECKSDILRNLNLSTKSGNFQTLDRRCAKHNIDLSNFKYKNNRGNTFLRTLSDDEIFIENSFVNGKTVRQRLIKDKLIEYKCKKCNNDGEWNGMTLTLQLDHINGDNKNHRLENLRFLCPNCHSQTPTYGSKKLKCGYS